MKKILIILTILLISACESGPKGAPPTLEVGKQAPPFSLELLDGQTYDYTENADAPLVLVYMASWCPCTHDSVPAFKAVFDEYAPKGVKFLMVGIQDSESKFTSFYKKSGLEFPAGFDGASEIAKLYGVSAPPTTFFISKGGKVASAFYGKIDQKQRLAAWVDEITEITQRVEGNANKPG